MVRFLNWLIWSSKNPNEISRTLKTIAGLTVVTTIAHQLGLDNLVTGGAVDTYTEIIVAVSQIVLGILSLKFGKDKITNNNNNNQ